MSLGNPLGNTLGNPLGLMSKAGGGVKVQSGFQFGPSGSPVVARFPLKKVNVNKAIIFASMQGAGSDGSSQTEAFAFTSLEEEAITFTTQRSQSSYWPTLSWIVMEIESIKKITRPIVALPASSQSSVVVPLPDGTNREKTIVIPILKARTANQRAVDVCVQFTPAGFILNRGLLGPGVTTSTVDFMCQIVEFE